MVLSMPCPSCQEPFTIADDAKSSADSIPCPRCGQSINLTEFRASTAVVTSICSDIPAKTPEDENRVVEVVKADLSLAELSLEPPRRSLRRVFTVLWLLVLLLVLGLSIPGYRFVRDRYNPWLTEENWKRLQPNMSLEEVETIFSAGKPCSLAYVKGIVNPIATYRNQARQMIENEMNRPFANMPPFGSPLSQLFPQNGQTEWDVIIAQTKDVAWQATRQNAASWYRWKRGDTRLFVGVSAENKLRLAYWITNSSDILNSSLSWMHSVSPSAELEPGKPVPAKLPEEKLVETYIRHEEALHSMDPVETFEIKQWGPHDLRGELAGDLATVPAMIRFRFLLHPNKHVAIVRARFWFKLPWGEFKLCDRLYYVQGGFVLGSQNNPYGSKWLKVRRDAKQQLPLRP